MYLLFIFQLRNGCVSQVVNTRVFQLYRTGFFMLFHITVTATEIGTGNGRVLWATRGQMQPSGKKFVVWRYSPTTGQSLLSIVKWSTFANRSVWGLLLHKIFLIIFKIKLLCKCCTQLGTGPHLFTLLKKTTKLRSCDRDHVVQKLQVITIRPFTIRALSAYDLIQLGTFPSAKVTGRNL